MPVSFPVCPLSLVFCSVRPCLNAKSPTNISPPLSTINDSIFEFYRISFLKLMRSSCCFLLSLLCLEIALIIFRYAWTTNIVDRLLRPAYRSTIPDILSFSFLVENFILYIFSCLDRLLATLACISHNNQYIC